MHDTCSYKHHKASIVYSRSNHCPYYLEVENRGGVMINRYDSLGAKEQTELKLHVLFEECLIVNTSPNFKIPKSHLVMYLGSQLNKIPGCLRDSKYKPFNASKHTFKTRVHDS